MTNEDVNKKVVNWLAALLGLTVIQGHQSGPRPAIPYGMLSMANFTPLGEHERDVLYEELETLNSEGKAQIKATPDFELEFVYQFFVYGSAGPSKLRQLQSAVKLSQIQEPLMPELVVHEVGSVNLVPELVGQKWEPRAQANIVVRGKSSDGFIIDTIDEHQITIQQGT